MTLLIWLAAYSLLWGAVLWLSGRLLQRSPSVSGRVRQWIWRGATLLLIAPWIAAPVILMFGLGLAPAETVAAATVADAPLSDVAVMQALDAAPAETAVVVESGGTLWAALGAMNAAELALLAVIAGWLVRFVLAQVALRKLLGIVMLSRPAEGGPASDAIRKWASRLKLRRAPRLRMVAEQHSPFSYGVLRPTVCLPEGLEAKLSRQSLDLVVGHECLHVARGDGWLRPLERVTADVFWFNPFAWLIRRELDVARELAVDEAVVAFADVRIAYARTLRDVAGISAGLPVAAPAASMSLAGSRSLMLRVNRTLAHAKSRHGRAAIVAACVLGLLAAPVAVGQVMIVVPAPPAPIALAAPDAPQPPEVPAALEAPEALDEPRAVPDIPDAPDAPPAAEFSSADGSVRATFSAKVVSTSGDAARGFHVELLQLGSGENGETCLADMKGLGSLTVARNDMVKRGDLVGHARKGGQMMFSVACSDELDGAGRPKVSPAPAPPAPPAAPSPISAVAPVAPVPPVWPVSAAAPVAPAAPAVWPAPLAAPSPVTPAAPAVAPTPPTPRPRVKPIVLDGADHPVVRAPSHVSGSFGMRPDPISGRTSFHEGVDIAAKAGTDIHAPVEGVVIFAGVRGAYGKMVEIDAGDGVTLAFAQMQDIKVKMGDRIRPGVVVGTVGSSGRSTGPHLHFEVARDGRKQDPQQVAGLMLLAAQ